MDNKIKFMEWIERLLKDTNDNAQNNINDDNMYHYYCGQALAYETVLRYFELDNNNNKMKG